MKMVKTAIIAFLVSFSMATLVGAFLSGTFNATKWEVIGQMLFCLFIFFSTVVSACQAND